MTIYCSYQKTNYNMLYFSRQWVSVKGIFVSLYYEWSPAIVEAMEDDEGFKEEVKEMIDGILPLIKTEVE